MTLKDKLKDLMGPMVLQYLRRIKVWFRRKRLFLTKGIKYLTWGAVVTRLQAKTKNLLWHLRGCPGKKILWVGCFPYWHRNVGDQAQTLALEKFFADKYPDHHVIVVTRQEVGTSRWQRIVEIIKPDDLIMIHSTGDFGSKYISQKSYIGGLSWAEVRREIVNTFPQNRLVQLPVTVFYQDDDEGEQAVLDDREAFRDKNFITLCRESRSLEILTQRDICRHEFFPDFVFYLKPEITNETRSGVLLLLRGKDGESLFSDADKDHIKTLLESVTPDVDAIDIMKADFPMPPVIRENFINEVMLKFQNYELVVTDRMHGMILAVITQTPCIALDEAIPHKLSGYRRLLSPSVTFLSNLPEISVAVEQAMKKPYVTTDLRRSFEAFKNENFTNSNSQKSSSI